MPVSHRRVSLLGGWSFSLLAMISLRMDTLKPYTLKPRNRNKPETTNPVQPPKTRNRNLGHFEAGSYRYLSLIEALFTF